MTEISYKKVFNKEYTRLNLQQKNAVDAIDGPVMVIAGAGTGKTQTIAMRIANILLKTDTLPHSILCLTFTDNASFNMRQRLLSLIGPTAYSVQIHTFHSFCNLVIQSNPDKFPQTDTNSIEEIDKISLVGQILDNQSLGSPLRPRGAPDLYLRDIISSLQTLKREGFSPNSFAKLIKKHQLFIQNNQNNYQQLKSLRSSKTMEINLLEILKNILENKSTPTYFKGLFSQKYKLYQNDFYSSGKAKNPTVNFKNDLLLAFDQVAKNIDKQNQLCHIYASYQKKLQESALYDFDDMINFVVDKFKNDSDFLRQYQEQVHYILVDEFQDSNNSQIKLLKLLSSYFDKPNLFVVGDDDQSIFRFQGASIENILAFYQTYQPQTFILINNYRSHQLILDGSRSLIDRNRSQLIGLIKNIDKRLVSQVDYDPDPINLFQATTPLQEATLVVDRVLALIQTGTKPEQIAILYRRHADVGLISKLLIKKNIKFSQSRPNCLKSDHLSYLIRILNVVSQPQNDLALFSFLSLPIFDISPLTLIKILHRVRKSNITLADFLYSQQLKSKKIKTLIKKVADCHLQTQNLSLDKLFIYILDRFFYLKFMSRQPNSFIAMSDLYSLFVYLKSFQQIHPPQTGLDLFVNRLKLLLQNNLSIPSAKPSCQPDSLNLLTVHGAKGLEFDHVFIISCLDGHWGNTRQVNKLPLPLGIVKTSPEDANQEERRLFYVALTRAKKQIYLSYFDTNLSGRHKSPSQFIFEINPDLIEDRPIDVKINTGVLNDILSIDKSDHFITDHNRQYLLDYLQNRYKFNISHLNSYLNCPHCFYYKTILKVPLAKTVSLSFGTAIHAGLAYLYKNPQANFADLYKVFDDILTQEFLDQRDYKSLLAQGKTVLKNYLDNHPKPTGKYCIEKNFYSHDIHLDGIPITGKIDKIEILSTKTDGRTDVIVTDFKTGRPDYASSKVVAGFDDKAGSYFRQILFYKLLLDLSPQLNYHFKQGLIDYVEPDKNGRLIQKSIDINDKDINSLKTLIKQTYRNILDLKFPINPNCKDRQHLHDLT